MKRAPYLVLVVLVILVPSLGIEADTGLRVGVIQSTTGIAAEDGKTVVQALELAAERLAQTDTPVQLIIEDDQTSPQQTVSAYQNLKAKGVDVIVGATWDFTTNTLMSLAGRDKLILFNTSTLPESVKIEESNGYAFTNAISTLREAVPFQRFISKNRPKSIVIVYANNSWGETQRRVYRGITKKAGVALLGEYSSVSFDQNEWRTILPLIKAKQPEVLLLLLNKNDLELFLRRAQETRFMPRFFASKNAYDAVQATQTPSLYEGLCFTYPYEQLRSSESFMAAYRQRFKEEPRIYADNSYDALFLLARAHRAALKGKISLRQALLKTDLFGVVGHYTYSPDSSFSLGSASLLCVSEGKAKLLSDGVSSHDRSKERTTLSHTGSPGSG